MPDLTALKWKYEHTRDKGFYRKHGDEYQIHVIPGVSSAPIAGSRPKKSSKASLANPSWKALRSAGLSVAVNMRARGAYLRKK